MINRKTTLSASGIIIASCVLALLLIITMSSNTALALPLCQTTTVTPTATAVLPPMPVSDSIDVERSPEIVILVPGQDVTVDLRLTGQARDDCGGIPGKPVNATLLFDISASAGMGPGSNWDKTKQITKILLAVMNRPVYRTVAAAPEISRVALVSSQTGMYGPEPVMLQQLTDDYVLLQSQVDNLAPGGDTDLADGLRMAAEELLGAPEDRALAVVLMLHDSIAIDESLEQAVGEVRGRGIKVYVIVNSLNLPAEKQITRAIASPIAADDEILIDPGPNDLRKLFIDATEGKGDLAAAGILVNEAFAPQGAVQPSAVSGPGGRAESDCVWWEISSLPFDQTVDLSYRLSSYSGDGSGVSISSQLAWLDCNGYPQGTQTAEQVAAGTPEVEDSPEPPEEPDDADAPPTPPGSTVEPDTPVDGRTDPPDLPNSGPWARLIRFVGSLPGVLKVALPILALLLLLLLMWLLWRLLRGTGGHVAGPSKPVLIEPPDGGKPKLRRKPDGSDLLGNWSTPERVTDRSGRPLTIRLGPTADIIEQAFKSSQDSTMVVRIEEGDRVLGCVELKLEQVTENNPLSEESRQWRRGVLVDGDSLTRQDPGRGIGILALNRAESLAREHKVQEMRGFLESSDSVAFFERHGYQVRRIPPGRYTLFKSLID